MRTLIRDYYDGRVSRRAFLGRLMATGLTAAAARSVLQAADLGILEGAAAAPGTLFRGTGGELLVEQVKAAGTRYIFTNPGSLEVAFFDALIDRPELELVVGLHEGIVIAMADAYHKVSRQPAFVNVHAAVGTAQIAGQMYNAHFDGSGLVVTAGMSDNTVGSDDMVLAPRRADRCTWRSRQGPSANRSKPRSCRARPSWWKRARARPPTRWRLRHAG
ncbi:MAG: thiamine pyrophosphate-binding protein [Vicinamibacterales bacterium]